MDKRISEQRSVGGIFYKEILIILMYKKTESGKI